VTAALHVARANRNGAYDLVVNGEEGTLTLPRTFGRTAAMTIQIADVQEIEVRDIVERDSDGKEERKSHVILHATDDNGADSEATLAVWDDRDRAESLARWIRGVVPSKPTAG
jgi:hypothetical protein